MRWRNMRYSVYEEFRNIGCKRIDFLKKTIKKDIIGMTKSLKPEDILNSYLQKANTETSNHLAKKSVVGLYPNRIFGKIIWKK